MIKGVDGSKKKILAACEDYMTTADIAKIVGIHRKTVCQYIRELGDCVLIHKGAVPWTYKKNPDKEFSPNPAMTRQQIWQSMKDAKENFTAPLLPQGPLSFLMEPKRYTPKEGRKVEEKHGSWITPKHTGHIGCGSQAYVEMMG